MGVVFLVVYGAFAAFFWCAAQVAVNDLPDIVAVAYALAWCTVSARKLNLKQWHKMWREYSYWRKIVRVEPIANKVQNCLAPLTGLVTVCGREYAAGSRNYVSSRDFVDMFMQSGGQDLFIDGIESDELSDAVKHQLVGYASRNCMVFDRLTPE